MPQDEVILVNDLDEQIGTMDKMAAHRGEGKLHRASSVFLFRKNKENRIELLIQQRSQQKIVGAGQWANTCCGNVRPGESYAACAERRLREELGITAVSLKPIHKFQYFAQCNNEFSEREIDQVFAGWYEGVVKPNPDEVAQFTWMSFDELMKNKKMDFAPWFVIMLDKPELVQLLTQFTQNI